MASTVWKGQLTFGMVSFPVRLVRAARKERVALKYVQERRQEPAWSSLELESDPPVDIGISPQSPAAPEAEVVPVRQAYFSDEQPEPSRAAELQRAYEVAPDQFVVVRSEELKTLRKATSPDMQILRSVKMQEIDPVFLETSYYVVPGTNGEQAYGLFYRALRDTGLAALAEVAMHGREHVVVVRPGAKGLIAHTMYYVNEVRAIEEYTTDATAAGGKELDLAKRFVEALAEPFRPEEFTDKYREQMEALIASKTPAPAVARTAATTKVDSKVVNIMDALRRSLDAVEAAKAERKPAGAAAGSAPAAERKARRRKA